MNKRLLWTVSATVALLLLLGIAGAVSDAAYAALALLMLEPVSTARAAWLSATARDRDAFPSAASPAAVDRPVLILPGAAGTWKYLLPLVRALSGRRDVRVVSLSPGGATPDDRARVQAVIEGLGECDVVSHSMGGLLAVELACMKQVRRVVTVALPTEAGDSGCMKKIRNVNAKPDAIVGKRRSAVQHVFIRSGHLSVVYHRDTAPAVLRMLE